jgi:hypothetical protein
MKMDPLNNKVLPNLTRNNNSFYHKFLKNIYSIMEEQTQESKKEDFHKYLEQSGVIEEITKMLVGLYEEPDKPNNAMEFL